jgi:hypothetical protein
MFRVLEKKGCLSEIGLAIILLVTLSAAVSATSFQQSSNLENGPGGAALTISLEGLLRVLASHAGDEVSEAMVIELIDMYGLSFRPSVDDIERLKKQSASGDLLQAIERAKKPAPPKPAIKMGEVAVICQPVDCDVWLDGNLIGTTIEGVLRGVTLPEGSVSVSAASPSYEADRGKAEALIRANETTWIQFAFKPSRAALEAAGVKLFRQMLDSVPVGTDGSKAGVFRVGGTIYFHEIGRPLTAWSVVARLRDPDLASFEFARLREKYRITRAETGYSWNKPLKSQEARELEDAVRQIVDYQLPRLVERLNDSRLTKVAARLEVRDETPAVFRAEGSSETYVVTLDSANHPSEIRLESSGLSSGLRVLYSDYIEQGGVVYPKTLQVILPDGAHGIEARFETVQIGAPEKSSSR